MKSLKNALLVAALSIGTTQVPLAFSMTTPTPNVVYNHVHFPVDYTGNTGFDLNDTNHKKLVLSSLIAGVLLGHMIDHKYPTLKGNYNKNYIYGTLFGQLIQEDTSPEGHDNDDFIDSAAQRSLLLAPGQGGPFQLNFYASPVPYAGDGNVGLANFVSLYKNIGYTISAQDDNSQKSKNTPDSFDNVYFAPMAAAYFHFNDIHAIGIAQGAQWQACLAKIEEGDFPHIDLALNAAYNAGHWSDMMKKTIDICVDGDHDMATTFVDYGLNNKDFTQKFNLPSSYASEDTTFTRYPRQIRYHVDQLLNNNANLNKYKDKNGQSLQSDNDISFSLDAVKDAFVKSFSMLGYIDKSDGKYRLITAEKATQAFDQSAQSNHAKGPFHLGEESERDQFYQLIYDAISNLGVDFTQTVASDDEIKPAG